MKSAEKHKLSFSVDQEVVPFTNMMYELQLTTLDPLWVTPRKCAVYSGPLMASYWQVAAMITCLISGIRVKQTYHFTISLIIKLLSGYCVNLIYDINPQCFCITPWKVICSTLHKWRFVFQPGSSVFVAVWMLSGLCFWYIFWDINRALVHSWPSGHEKL